MGQAKARGTREQRIAQAIEQAQLMKMPEQFFGYNREQRAHESAFEITTDGLVCMVSSVVPVNLEATRQHSGIDFKLGDWFCSTGAHENTVVHGPFKSAEEGFEFARQKVGAIRFQAGPEWDF